MLSHEYAAGFFDGEGSVYAADRRSATVTRRPSPTILVCVANTNFEVLEILQRQWGGSLLARKERPCHRKQYQWVLSARGAYPFLLAIAPFVVIKRDVVAVAIQLCEMMRRPAKERVDYSTRMSPSGRLHTYPKVKPEFEIATRSLHNEIRRLNMRGAPFNKLRRHNGGEVQHKEFA